MASAIYRIMHLNQLCSLLADLLTARWSHTGSPPKCPTCPQIPVSLFAPEEPPPRLAQSSWSFSLPGTNRQGGVTGMGTQDGVGGRGTGTEARQHLGCRPSCTGSPSGHCTRPSPHPRRNGGPQGGTATAWREALSHSGPGRPGGRYSGRSAAGGRGAGLSHWTQTGTQTQTSARTPARPGALAQQTARSCAAPGQSRRDRPPTPSPPARHPLTVRKCKALGRLVLTLSAAAT